MSDLRRPTADEQAVIAATYAAIAGLQSKRIEIESIGMSSHAIEDKEHGRWKSLLGYDVFEVLDGGTEVYLLLRVDAVPLPRHEEDPQ